MRFDRYHLYHLRDPERSAGFGMDSYTGTTGRRPIERFHEHMRACASRRHSNPKIQAMYDEAGGRLQMIVMRSGTREEILAAEALTVQRANLHANIQPGGGPLRGKARDVLIDLMHGADKGRAEDVPNAVAQQEHSRSLSNGELILIATAAVVVLGGVAYCLYQRRQVRRLYRNTGAAVGKDSGTRAEPSPRSDALKIGHAVRPNTRFNRFGDRALWVLSETYPVLSLVALAVMHRE